MKLFQFLSNIFSSKQPSKKGPLAMEKLFKEVFPDGKSQIDEEAEMICAILKRKLSLEDSKMLLTRSKPLYYIARDKSEKRVFEIVQNATKISLSRDELSLIQKFFVNYFCLSTALGDGSTAEKCVIINANSSIIGNSEIGAYIERSFGEKDCDYAILSETEEQIMGKKYKLCRISLKDGSKRTIWFDISAFGA